MNRLRSELLVITAGLSLFAAGCKSAPAPVKNADGTITNPDGSVTIPAPTPLPPGAVRNQDGSISNPDGSVTYPAGSSVAQRGGPPATAPKPYSPAPTSPAPSSASTLPAPAPPPTRLTVPAGTRVSIRLNGGLAASRNEVGDRFTGVLNSAVESQGATVFASGTPVSGEVVSSRGKGRFKGAGDLGISLTAIGRDPVETNVYERSAKGRGKRTAGFIGGGAGLGALIGGLAGGGKGALIGGLSGAGAGTAAGASHWQSRRSHPVGIRHHLPADAHHHQVGRTAQ